MNKIYKRINWQNEPSLFTPINETNLNAMDYAINEIDNRVVSLDADKSSKVELNTAKTELNNEITRLDTTKAKQSDLLNTVNNVAYDPSTGTFTFTFHNGTVVVADLNIEKIPVSFSMNAKGVITMRTEDGSEYTADVGALIKEYAFDDSSVIDFTVTVDSDGVKRVSADIVNGSIDGTKLQPNYLADCQSAVNDADSYATNAYNSANDSMEYSTDAEAWANGQRNGVPVPATDPAYQNNAKYYKDQAQSTAFAQSDWNETNPTQSAYINNKPFQDIGNGLSVNNGVLEANAQTINELNDIGDVNINSPIDKQVLIYDSLNNEWINGETSPGLLPRLRITTETGSVVTVVKDTTILNPVLIGDAWEVDIPEYGEWEVHSVNAQGDAVVVVNVDMVKIYNVNASHFNATINVDFPSGAFCTCVNGTESYTANTTPYAFSVHSAGIWTVSASMDGETVSQTVNIVSDGQSANVTLVFATLTVTIADDLIGETVVVTDESKSKSWVATSNTHTFVVGFGTWKASITKGGTVYESEEVVVNSYTEYTVEIASFNYQGWLDAANITKSFSSLDDVLADETVVRELMTKHASADYLIDWYENDNAIVDTFVANVNAMKWIGHRDYICDKLLAIPTWKSAMLESENWEYILKDKVPTMTSNNAPYGEAFSTNYSGQAQAYGSFNGIYTSDNGDSGSSTYYIGYKFTNPTCVKRLWVKNRITNPSMFKNFKFEGSNDGVTYTTIATLENTHNEGGYEQYFEIENNDYYLYYRIFVTSVFTGYCSFGNLQFYGRSLNVSVPTMTSNTEPFYEISDSLNNASYPIKNAFDGKTDTFFYDNNDSDFSVVSVKFNKPTMIKAFDYYFGNLDGNCVTKMQVWGIKADNTLEDIGAYDIPPKANTHNIILLNTDKPYIGCAFKPLEKYQGTTQKHWAVYELNVFGIDYSEREFAEGSTIKYLYDNGLELEEFETIGSGSFERKANEYIVGGTASGQTNFIITKNAIDITPYSRLRWKVGSVYVADTYNGLAIYSASGTSSPLSTVQNGAMQLPNNTSAGATSINQSGKCSVYTSNMGKSSISELWLE